MSRTISLTAIAAGNAEQTNEVWVFLITVEHEALEDGPERFSSNATERLSDDPLRYGTTSRGNVYEFLPLSMVLPDDSEGVPPALKLVLDNVLRQAVPLLRSITTPAAVTVEMVLASDPDTVEVSYPAFDLVNSDYDAQGVSIDLTVNALANEPYPAGTFTPGGFGGLF
jgi:hypothetical protein